jgi:hypothetical protein
LILREKSKMLAFFPIRFQPAAAGRLAQSAQIRVQFISLILALN